MRYSPALAAIALMLCNLAAAPSANLLLNGDAEQGKADQPSIWFPASVPAPELTMGRDLRVAHAGQASLVIDNRHNYSQPTSNNWAQSLQNVPAGETVVVRGWIRTADADSANICLQCWDASGNEMLAFASTPVVRGDQDWIDLRSDAVTVPANTRSILVRAALTGKGKAWFDDIAVTPQPASAAAATTPVATSDLSTAVGGRIEGTVAIDRDQMVLAYLPEWAHGKVDNIAVADNGVRTLLAWPADKIDATLATSGRRWVLALYARMTTVTGDGQKVLVCPVTEEWNERTPWTAQPKFATEGAAEFPIVPGAGWKTFDVTGIVKRQAEQKQPFHGVVLRFGVEDKPQDAWSGYEFVSREGEGEWRTRRPVLLVLEK